MSWELKQPPHRAAQSPGRAGAARVSVGRRVGPVAVPSRWAVLAWLAGALLALAQSTWSDESSVVGLIVDEPSGRPLVGVTVRLEPMGGEGTTRVAGTDSTGRFRIDGLEAGAWSVHVEVLGYEPARRRIALEGTAVEANFELRVQPLLMDEMVVQAQRAGGERPTPAFVEVISVGEHRPGVSLTDILDQAVGVNIRNSGGLGSFSTVSIRGSTAEQVQVFLDGVPLNQAQGGGVDMADLPVEGVESVEIYRGAVPARFGGNSIGGVIHVRTRALEAGRRLRGQAMLGAWGTRQIGGSVEGVWRGRRYLAMADYSGSRNDFSFLDDNGTEYNLDDDEPARRLNSDVRGLRSLVKAEERLGRSRLQVRNTFDIKHQGIPSISNNQSRSTRLDKWRSVTETELFGAVAGSGRTGYRLTLYHLLQRYRYKDPEGTVGVGKQHDRNTTGSAGVRAELNRLVFRDGIVTLFGGARREAFDSRDLFHPESAPLESRRRSGTVGWEAEIPIWLNLLQLTGGGQMEVIEDRFQGPGPLPTSPPGPVKTNTESLRGGRIGGEFRLGVDWTLKGHRGWHQRAPSFYELFGDRGAVVGNTKLESEAGKNWDVGLVWSRPRSEEAGVHLLEANYFCNEVDDLIRFIQNAQRVSRPSNIGRARIRGVELRGGARLAAQMEVSANYAYQRAENRTTVSYERGKDLPNAPRRTLNLRASLGRPRARAYYELSRESRHFLDKSNLRSVPRRTLHNLGVSLRPQGLGEWSLEVRNLTGNQVADLWGYPLPGRSFFLSFKQSLELVSGPALTSGGS